MLDISNKYIQINTDVSRLPDFMSTKLKCNTIHAIIFIFSVV